MEIDIVEIQLEHVACLVRTKAHCKMPLCHTIPSFFLNFQKCIDFYECWLHTRDENDCRCLLLCNYSAYWKIKEYLTQYQFSCGILKMVGPKKQNFWQKINILKGNHCILRIQGAPVRQKLGMILENKVVQKLKKNGLLNWYC